MKTIIAEKPSVAKEIARIIGADKRKDGYIEGNGYAVTWAYGHLIQLAMPDSYGVRGFAKECLPIIPETFTLLPRQVKTDSGYKADVTVTKQIKTIAHLFNDSERIIVATDAGREGELIFRYLYQHLDCHTPFDRLWISSHTDKAIRDGLDNICDGHKYDNLYFAAKARSEADWLVGINATQAISIAAARGTYSLGRVQTPTLAMICKRYYDNEQFTPETYWQLHFIIERDGGNGRKTKAEHSVRFTSAERWTDKTVADETFNKVSASGKAIITDVERKESREEAPLLYDLTALQKEANRRYGFTAEQTLGIAQELYEKKLITYPRTGSRYIPEDVYEGIPKLLSFLKEFPNRSNNVPAPRELTRRGVDDSKVTDHHALLVTGVKPLFLSSRNQTVYDMIAYRMAETFSPDCVRDITTVTADCEGTLFRTRGNRLKQAGWRRITGNDDSETGGQADRDVLLPDWQKGDVLTFPAVSITEGKTKAKPLHTEATLLAAMENCGKETEDETLRTAMKDCGIGTPATRAAIIETLFTRGYVTRQKKLLVPTEKGLALYSVVKSKLIADVRMTGEWEKELARIERGELSADTFRTHIEQYTSDITSELLSCGSLFTQRTTDCACPKCGKGMMQFYGKVVRCDNADCGLPVFRQKAGRMFSDDEIKDLLTSGRTKLLKGFKSKQGKSFDAVVVFDSEFNTQFEFPEKGKKTGGKQRKI
ncbi:MAG: DNA topoisomerase III [Prevotella sp.]|nr:DNA topoisomerase III [Prevotella sp.]